MVDDEILWIAIIENANKVIPKASSSSFSKERPKENILLSLKAGTDRQIGHSPFLSLKLRGDKETSWSVTLCASILWSH